MGGCYQLWDGNRENGFGTVHGNNTDTHKRQFEKELRMSKDRLSDWIEFNVLWYGPRLMNNPNPGEYAPKHDNRNQTQHDETMRIINADADLIEENRQKQLRRG